MNINKLVECHLYNYRIFNGVGEDVYELLQRQIEDGQDLQDRRNFEGHVTSSFLLLDPTETEVLLIHHRLFDRWLPPGGHYEGDVTLRQSAIRELHEETGCPIENVEYYSGVGYLAIDVDTHPIPARPHKDEDEHFHHDFLYLGIAKEKFEPIPQEEEVLGAKWTSITEVLENSSGRLKRNMQQVLDMIAAKKRGDKYHV